MLGAETISGEATGASANLTPGKIQDGGPPLHTHTLTYTLARTHTHRHPSSHARTHAYTQASKLARSHARTHTQASKLARSHARTLARTHTIYKIYSVSAFILLASAYH